MPVLLTLVENLTRLLNLEYSNLLFQQSPSKRFDYQVEAFRKVLVRIPNFKISYILV